MFASLGALGSTVREPQETAEPSAYGEDEEAPSLVEAEYNG